MIEKKRAAIRKQLLWFALPIYCSNLLQQLYQATDMIILGQFFGNNAIAAVGATASLVYMIIHVIGGITTGLSVHTSSCDGNADWPGLARYHMANIWICLVGAVGLFILFWFSTDLLLKALQVPTAIYTDAKIYIRIIFAGIPVTVFNNLWGATLRGLKDSKTPALSLVISILLNFVLDWILIAVFRCGVLGAALATVLSQTLAAIICYIGLQRLLTRKAILCKKICDFPIEEIKKSVGLAIPYGLQFFVTSVGITVVQIVVNQFGEQTIAGFTVASKLHALLAQLHVSVGGAVLVFAAQCASEEKNHNISELTAAMRPVFLLIAVMNYIIVAVFGNSLVMLFNPEATPMMLKAAGRYLQVTSLFYPFLSLIFLYRNILVGLGHSTITLLCATVELIVRFILSVILSRWFEYTAVCLADPVAWLAGLIPLCVLYNRIKRQILEKRNDAKHNQIQ